MIFIIWVTIFLYILALDVDFQSIVYNVSEMNGLIEIMITASGISEFDYTVNLTVFDLTTGGLYLSVPPACA